MPDRVAEVLQLVDGVSRRAVPALVQLDAAALPRGGRGDAPGRVLEQRLEGV